MTETFEQMVARKAKERKAREEAERRRIYSDSSDYQPTRFEPLPTFEPYFYSEPTPSPSYDPSSTSSDSGSSSGSDWSGFDGGSSGGGGSSDSW